ncbi:hypothetical protein ACQPYK_49570 (plasmid) [Streptosporangium sp. CA-135522]|uniref:hypothetical protein n=1 Tax=Streptosporangium sp. CA-135522 TaxID=3240072 RepID=UPI003D8EFFF3
MPLVGKVPPPMNSWVPGTCIRICRQTGCPQFAAFVGIFSDVQHPELFTIYEADEPVITAIEEPDPDADRRIAAEIVHMLTEKFDL